MARSVRRVYYDLEFLDTGRALDVISIGMIDDQGTTFYGVNSEMPDWQIRRHPWLMANVVPHLPQRGNQPKHWLYDHLGPNVMTRTMLARSVHKYLVGGLGGRELQLWAWYAAFDHVGLSWLFGSMGEHPDGIPMWTNDLRQEVERVGNPTLPDVPGLTAHNALDDARELRVRCQWLAKTFPGAMCA